MIIDDVPQDITSMKDPRQSKANSFVSAPMINRYRKTLHFRLAICAGISLQCGYQQNKYLEATFNPFNEQAIQTFVSDPNTGTSSA